MEHLLQVIRYHPVIDNHAHNLLRVEKISKYDFLTSTTEAQGDALKDTKTSLSHIRAAKQLKELYGANADDWESIKAARVAYLERDADGLIRKCLEGTFTILMDDGLDQTDVYPYSWHNQFCTAPVKRIVRVEAVAEEIVKTKVAPGCRAALIEQSEAFDQSATFETFAAAITQEVRNAMADTEVVGFKSVVCYRTGLSIAKVDVDNPGGVLLSNFQEYVTRGLAGGKFRLETKTLNDWLVRMTLKEISTAAEKGLPSKPLQFHTGLGDNDIDLLLSDPSHLQPLIEDFPKAPFIILHSSYPFTRSAGYLAMAYSNTYLDIGEVFPMLGRDGQEAVVRQALELTPWSKLLWSTDGHHFPETYWLANKQFRRVLEKVLVDYVQSGDLSAEQATRLTRDLLFNNSNRVYNLGLDASIVPSIAALQTMAGPSSTTTRNSIPASPIPASYELNLWESFELQYPVPSYIYIQWLDRMAQLRNRVVPVKHFKSLLFNGGQISISNGNTGTLQNDSATAVVNPIGQIFVRPDLQSLRPTHPFDTLRRDLANGSRKTTATIMSSWCDELGTPLSYCHRSRVQALCAAAEHEFNVTFLVGFEIEITFFHVKQLGKPHAPFVENQAWSTMFPEQWSKLSVFGEIIDALADMGIDIQQFHAESAPGQYEFVLPPLPPVEAIDTLIQAKQAIQQLAYRHNLRATLHPSPAPGIGTGAHAHISLTPPDRAQQFFVGGVLEHIRALCALSLPQQVSYNRVVDDSWMCGTWVCWGTQNRETPLRKVTDGRWEVRCLDGCANMYIAIAGILAAGLLGMREGGEVKVKDCQANPSKLSESQREDLGITRRLPRSLNESLRALSDDEELADVLGKEMTSEYVIMKEAELEMLAKMSEDDRRTWLIERY